MYVRTIVDVPAGAQLTVCHAQAYDPRAVRQAALLQVGACTGRHVQGCPGGLGSAAPRPGAGPRTSWARLRGGACRDLRPAQPGLPAYLHTPRRAAPFCAAQERGIKCACERCSESLAKSTDRYLEGVWCLNCTTDVLLAVPPGTPEAEAAAAVYEEQVRVAGGEASLS